MSNAATQQWSVGHDVSAWPMMKVAQAGVHVSSLRARVGLWNSSQPLTVRLKPREDRLGATWTLSMRTAPPTMEWSLCVGDCIHQLRSALDSCVWEFATMDGRKPPRPQRVQFPIVGEAERWTRAVTDHLQTVPDAIVERIRAVQPFNRPVDLRPTDGLLILQELSNQDKHRSHVRAVVDTQELAHKVRLEFADEAASARNGPPDITVHGPDLEDGAVLSELKTVDPIVSLEGTFSVKFQLMIDALSTKVELFRTLEDLAGFVNGILVGVYNGWEADQSRDGWVPFEPCPPPGAAP
jgi:hypothetical protein